jgi:hypothetical protein
MGMNSKIKQAVVAVALIFCAAQPMSAQIIDMDITRVDEHLPPSGMPFYPPPPFMHYANTAAMHDARWLPAGAGHIAGLAARISDQLSSANTVFIRIGDSFTKTLKAAAVIQKSAETIKQIKRQI